MSCWLLAIVGAAQGGEETIVLRPPLPDRIDRIEVVWSGDAEPTVLINQSEPPLRRTERWGGSEVQLIPAAEQLRPFGSCSVSWTVRGKELVIQFAGTARTACGVIWFLSQPEQAVDILSFQTLKLVGSASGTIELGMADRVWWNKQDHIAWGTVKGPFEVDVLLPRLIDHVDLRELVALTVTAVELPAELTITKAWFEAAPIGRPGPMKRGLWVWDLQKVQQQADQVVKTCRSIGCRRLSVQMPPADNPAPVWQAYCSLIRRWRDEGIDVFALDGWPEAAVNPDRLLSGIRRLVTECGDSLPAGLQVDIEPYLLPETRLGQDRYRDYVAMLTDIRRALPSHLSFSVVVPFWFTHLSIEGRSLALHVFKVADEVVVMSYRVDATERQALLDDWIRYGALLGKPVWGAIETRPLSDEQHLVLRRVSRPADATAFLDRSQGELVLTAPRSANPQLFYFAETARYHVQGQWLSFAGRSKETVKKAIEDWAAESNRPAVTGLMVHDWEGYEQLP
ncbi:MAG: hypothetical protein LDL14_10990 [Nitrospira sp.]|nr:hypothetical protein [Nitrospira sp.]